MSKLARPRFYIVKAQNLICNLYKTRHLTTIFKKQFSRDGDCVWQCANCGHIVIGKKAPEMCPVCAHPQSYFQLNAENY